MNKLFKKTKKERQRHKSPQYYISRYALATIIQEYIAYKILDPYYLQFMTTSRGINLTAAQFGVFVAISNVASAALDYLTGAMADKYGRCHIWAYSAFFYGGGMLWLAFSQSYFWSLPAAICMGISYALASGSPQAWIYDEIKGDGLRRAVGYVYQIAVPATLIGTGLGYALGFFGSIRLPIIITGIIVISNGVFILSFQDNYADDYERKSWVSLLKTGFQQFSSKPVLWLTALQSLFYFLPSWICTAWWITYLIDKFDVSSQFSSIAFGVVSLISSAAAGVIAHMKVPSMNRLIIVPTLLAVISYAVIPSVNNVFLYIALIAVATTAGYFRGAGITVLENNEVDAARATALSFMGSVRSFFWIIGPLIFGSIIDSIDFTNMFYLSSAACAVSLIILALAIFFSKKEKKD